MLTHTSRLGFHYHPDDRHNTPADFAPWVPILRSFGVRWLVIRVSASRAAPEEFVAAIRDEGIEPILHLPEVVGRSSLAELSPLLSAYARWGVRQVVIHDRVNLRSSWEPSEWSRIGIVERFLDRVIPLWTLQVDLGMVPVMPALEPGGDYWDTAFLEGTLRGIARRGQETLLENLALGAYAWTSGRPLDWGSGGPAAWPEARPYHTPEGSQDQRGLRLPEWYEAIAQSVIGKSLPIHVLGGGAVVPRGLEPGADPFHQNGGVARWVQGEEAPTSLHSFAFYLLTAEASSPEAHAAWYAAPDRPLQDVDPVRQALVAASKRMRPKSLAHYILLPEGATDPALWTLAGEVARRAPAAVGFSIEEAKQAARVTLLPGPEVFGERIRTELERVGSRVERWIPGDAPSDRARFPGGMRRLR